MALASVVFIWLMSIEESDVAFDIALDKDHCWHPFTRQSEWTAEDHEPVMIERAEGVWLHDTRGRSYIDGNASIWTNIHGHAHPWLNAAIKRQLDKVAHSSFLGYGHPLAGRLAEKLVSFFPESSLRRVFYSDDGSTAVECALKMALQYRLQTGEESRVEFIAFDNAYHGDTLGAASLGGVSAFFERFRRFGITVHFVSSMAELERFGDAANIAGVIVEPLVQGVNQIHVWEEGMLSALRKWTEERGVHLILDEVMTGFGRTGTMFACQQEGVIPDFLCLAKGLTGGYLPMAATLVREEVYEAFLGAADKAFYYGHSYTANPLGCAAALASLELFEKEHTLVGVGEKSLHIKYVLESLLAENAFVYDVRQCGMVAGVELRQVNGERFDPSLRIGEQVCMAARKYQLLTRPILDTIVILPPLSITRDELDIVFNAIAQSIDDVLNTMT